MRNNSRRLWTALAIAVTGYVTALLAGAGAAFVAMFGVGIAGEIWFWTELVRRWRGRSEPANGT